jgi:uncharacterized membrane protein (UPF0127 family)
MFNRKIEFSTTFVIVVIIIFLIFIGTMGAIVYRYTRTVNSNTMIIDSFPSLKIKDRTYRLEIASSESARMKGLSDRPSLPSNRVLLFTFDQEDYWRIWMKDMHFSIDVIWLDTDYRIVDAYENMAPETYPKSFAPKKPARYIYEANAGFVRENSLKIGDRLPPDVE